MTSTDTMTNVRMRKSGKEPVRTVEGTLNNLAATIRTQAGRPLRPDAGGNDAITPNTLPHYAVVAAAVDAGLHDAVAYLRSVGYSWSEIAAGLGVSKQAAMKRFRGGES